MLTKCLTDDSFDIIPVYCTWKYFFSCDYSKPGVCLTIAHKKYFETFILDAFRVNNMVETVFTQQSVRIGKFGRYAKPQVWRGPWHGAH